MRINKYLALITGLSRRGADAAIAEGRVLVNGAVATSGTQVDTNDRLTLDGIALTTVPELSTVMLNKPVGYVCSRAGQGSKTVYELLPPNLYHLKPVGRLDKDSSGLLIMTNDGNLANELTHPSHKKVKRYEVELNVSLDKKDWERVTSRGVELDDGTSKFQLDRLDNRSDLKWRVTMHEGRNRQIRRTFSALDYTVIRLHRTDFGIYHLGDLRAGIYKFV